MAVIDDDESVRLALRGLLRSLGYNAEAFASVEDFLRAAPTGDHACVIVDLHLPGMSGRDLRRELAALGRSLPIVFMSGLGEGMPEEAAAAADAPPFLTKPFGSASLLAALSVAMEQWAAMEQSSPPEPV